MRGDGPLVPFSMNKESKTQLDKQLRAIKNTDYFHLKKKMIFLTFDNQIPSRFDS